MGKNDKDEAFDLAMQQTDALLRQYASQIALMADTTVQVLAALNATSGGATDQSDTVAKATADLTAQAQVPDADIGAIEVTSETIGMVLQNAVSMQQMLAVLGQAVCNQCVTHIYAATPESRATGAAQDD